MYAATAEWTPGANNVTGQNYTWAINGNVVFNGSLGPMVTSTDSSSDGLVINHGDDVAFGVTSKNPWNESERATASGTAPTPIPDPPTGVTLTFRELPAAARR